MQTQIQNWQRQIADINARFQESFGQLSGEALNYKPSPTSWSIAENIDHLITINQTYYPILDQLHAGTYSLPWHAKIPFVAGWFGKMILQSVEPGRKRKMKTFPIWEPGQSDLGEDILQKFDAHQLELSERIAQALPLLEKGTLISSPANNTIVYTLETAFEIIVTHEMRHFNQAMEVLHQMD
jgi:uncharacterized damage-inducible protein DinB